MSKSNMLTEFLTCFWAFLTMVVGVQPPNVIMFLADDLGWNDVSFHGSTQIPTPNIDALAASGIILNNFYVAPQCTPSRASLMTGRYPVNTGLQHNIINVGEATALPLEFQIMPQHFKKLGYATHMVGKWHLGFYKKKYTPTYRGFDTFFGYWNGQLDYYDYTSYEVTTVVPGTTAMWGIDLHNGTETIRDFRGRYAQDVFAEKAVEIIINHDVSEPLFLYMSNIATHTGNLYQPIQATPERVANYMHIRDPKRRQFAGVVSSLDETLGQLIQSLNDKGMLNNTIIAFCTDNGGEAAGIRGGQGSNAPLRGMKFDLWEGGVRAAALLWSPLLKLQKPRVSTQMMHISDWLPTLYSAAGGNVDDLGEIDGMDMLSHLLNNSPSPRNEIILQIDPIFNMIGLRMGDYKLIQGSHPISNNTWLGPFGQDISVSSMDEWVWKNGSVVKDILEQNGLWLIQVPDEWRKDAVVSCGIAHPPIGSSHPPTVTYKCDLKREPCLYNVVNDPCEFWNLAHKYPKIVSEMLNRIHEYNTTGMNTLSKEMDPRADPRCHGFAYVPWMDEEYASDCSWL